MPEIFILAGPNGAGKTTSSDQLLQGKLPTKQFLNADLIAKGLSPYEPESAAMEASRIMIRRMKHFQQQKQSFAFETNLSSVGFKSSILDWQNIGYTITLVFIYISSIELAKERVKLRVRSGGHNIPEETIEKRFTTGLKNLTNIYCKIVDQCFIYDNSYLDLSLIAKFEKGTETRILQKQKWDEIKNYA